MEGNTQEAGPDNVITAIVVDDGFVLHHFARSRVWWRNLLLFYSAHILRGHTSFVSPIFLNPFG